MKKKIFLFLNLLIILTLITSIWIIEVKSDWLIYIHTIMQNREIQSSIISYSYITIAVAIISLSAIAFTIVLGMMQYIVNAVSYQTYKTKVLKNKTFKRIFLASAIVSSILILIYLFADIKKLPLTYVSILLSSIYIVIRLILLLYTYLFEDYSISSLLEKGYDNILNKYNQLLSYSKKIKIAKEKISKQDYRIFKEKRKQKIVKAIHKMIIKAKEFDKQYWNALYTVTDELKFIATNARKNEDTNLLRGVLEYATKISEHRFNEFWSNTKKHPEVLNMMSIGEPYDKFIENKIIPIFYFNNFSIYSDEIVSLSNLEFGEILIRGKTLRHIDDDDGYNFTFNIIFSLYNDVIYKQIVTGYQGAVSDYRFTMNNIIDSFVSNQSRDLFMDISQNNIKLVKAVFENMEVVNYMHIMEVQAKLILVSLVDFEEYILHSILNDTFEMFYCSIMNFNKIKTPFTIQRLNSNWFDTLKPTALSIRLISLYNQKYSNNIDDKEKQREIKKIFEVIYQCLYSNGERFSVSAKLDPMIKLPYANLIYECTRILSIYFINNVSDFKSIYQHYLSLYGNFILHYDLKDKFDVHQFYRCFEEIIIDSLSNMEMRKIAIDEYIQFCTQVYQKSKKDRYSARCFDNALWLPILIDDYSLYDVLTPILLSNLDKEGIEVLQNDFISETDRRFGSPSLEKFDRAKKYDDENLSKVKEYLKTLIDN